jgi:hypothetical protein
VLLSGRRSSSSPGGSSSCTADEGASNSILNQMQHQVQQPIKWDVWIGVVECCVGSLGG